MKQKYLIFKNETSENLTIQEFAELDKEMFSLICEETYEAQLIKTALEEGKTKLIAKLRTPNLYPIAEYVDKIADSVIKIYQQPDAGDPVELVFDDVIQMRKSETVLRSVAVEDSGDADEIDDLLDEVDDDVDKSEIEEDDDELDMFDEDAEE
jgi:hypothetical protein